MAILFLRMANGYQTISSKGKIMTAATLEKLLPRERLRGFATKTPARYPSGKLWPHGEWSLGWASERPDGGEWHEDPYVGMGVDDTEAARAAAAQRLPLNLSDASNSHGAARRGLNGMSGHGQQMIKACGHLMQEHWPRFRKTLGTITLPPMSRQARVEVVEKWPELTRQLLQFLSRILKTQGVPQVICSVTEIQPERLRRSGEGCLHWHLLWLNIPARAGNWAVNPCDVRAWLDKALRRKCPSYQGGHVNVNVKSVEGKIAAYLAKYMSKGKQMIAEAVEDWGEDNCPRTWWNMTKPARDLVKANTCQGRATGALLERVLYKAFRHPVDVSYEFLRRIVITIDGHEFIAGWRGRFTDQLKAYLDRTEVPGLLA